MGYDCSDSEESKPLCGRMKTVPGANKQAALFAFVNFLAVPAAASISLLQRYNGSQTEVLD
jgi:hypothetical protein